MAQFARPATDVSDGGWTDQSGGTTLFAAIDETAASEGDYIKSVANPSSDTAEIRLGSINDPISAASHVVRYRIGKSGSSQINLVVSLRQGTTTEIASWTHLDVSATPITIAQTLSTAQANAITDYTDLRLRFVATVVAGGGGTDGSLDTAVQYSLWWINHGD